jgi:predicted nucleic acid-binding Zn finger protein
MQQIKIEHEKRASDQKVVEKAKKDRRPGKGRTMALSRRIYRLQNTDNTFYYVESEASDDQFYFVKFKPDVLESWYCSCKDNYTRRGLKCKHLFAIEFAIKWGTIKDIDKVPPIATEETAEEYVKIDTQTNIATKSTAVVVVSAIGPKSYKDDDYTF